MDIARPALSPATESFLSSAAPAGLLIGGTWQPAQSGETFDTLDPATGQTLAKIAKAGSADVDAAVAAARKALPEWKATTPLERAKLLWAIADKIEENIDELAEIETLDQGKPLFVGRWAEIPGAVNQFRFFGGQAMAIEGQTITSSINYQPEGKQMSTWTRREPVGVVAAILPWNSPLVLTAMKLAPALAAGCTIVLKPAEDTSLSSIRLAQLMSEAGLPDGVLNVVTGMGAETGSALAGHHDVNKVAFTGSTATGRAVLDAAKGNLKKVTLELGGKSPMIVMPDADLEQTIPGVANAIFFNGGQVCVAGSRLYAHKDIFDDLVAGVVEYGKNLKAGHGLDPATQMGPLVSQRQAEKVADYVKNAADAGATVHSGGDLYGPANTFMSPTVISNVDNTMPLVREEVFGPVLAAQAFDDVDAVIEAANDSDYGLAASVWTEGLSNAHRLSERIEAGTVWINCHLMYDAALPIGGMKQSGWGRDSGVQALDSYLEWKTVCAVV